MANLTNIIKVTEEQYRTLEGGGIITVGGQPYRYDENALYLVDGFGMTKYRHNIQIQYSTNYIATFSIITSDPSAYTAVAQIRTALNANGFTSATAICPAQGQYYVANQTNLVIGVYSNGSTLGFKYINLATTTDGTMTINEVVSTSYATNSNTPTIYDIVEAL